MVQPDCKTIYIIPVIARSIEAAVETYNKLATNILVLPFTDIKLLLIFEAPADQLKAVNRVSKFDRSTVREVSRPDIVVNARVAVTIFLNICVEAKLRRCGLLLSVQLTIYLGKHTSKGISTAEINCRIENCFRRCISIVNGYSVLI